MDDLNYLSIVYTLHNNEILKCFFIGAFGEILLLNKVVDGKVKNIYRKSDEIFLSISEATLLKLNHLIHKPIKLNKLLDCKNEDVQNIKNFNLGVSKCV